MACIRKQPKLTSPYRPIIRVIGVTANIKLFLNTWTYISVSNVYFLCAEWLTNTL